MANCEQKNEGNVKSRKIPKDYWGDPQAASVKTKQEYKGISSILARSVIQTK